MKKRFNGVLVALIAAGVMLVSAATAEAASLSIGFDPDGVTFGQSLDVKGKLDDTGGAAAGGRQVRLYSKPYPYKGSQLIATTVTGSNGKYRFNGITPEFNTRYRTTVSDAAVAARSRSRLAVVFAGGDLKVRATKKFVARSKFRLRFSPKLPLRLKGRKVLWYFHRNGTKRFTVRDRSRVSQKRKGLVSARSRFKLPRGNYRFQVAYCIVGLKRADIGLGVPVRDRSCPKSVSARSNVAFAARDFAPPPGGPLTTASASVQTP